jgi:hypothetical protein
MVDLWWIKLLWGRFSLSTLVSPASSHFMNCSIFINHPVIDAVIILMLTTSLNNKLKHIKFVVHSIPKNSYS